MHGTKQAFELRSGLKSALPDSYRALKGGGVCYLSVGKQHTKKTQDCEDDKNETKKKRIAQSRKQRITGKTILELICIITRGNLVTCVAKKTKSPSASCPFPGAMTTETTVSKGQEFFSTGQTEGDNRGDINWERCSVIVVVDTTKMDNVGCLNKQFL